jgi:hypothetical protein
MQKRNQLIKEADAYCQGGVRRATNPRQIGLGLIHPRVARQGRRRFAGEIFLITGLCSE